MQPGRDRMIGNGRLITQPPVQVIPGAADECAWAVGHEPTLSWDRLGNQRAAQYHPAHVFTGHGSPQEHRSASNPRVGVGRIYGAASASERAGCRAEEAARCRAEGAELLQEALERHGMSLG